MVVYSAIIINVGEVGMNSIRIFAASLLLFFVIDSQAQMSSLPQTATGARALPFAHVEVSWYGAMF